MWFFNKKRDKNVDPTIEERIKKIEDQVVDLFTDYDLLRDKVLRKIQSRSIKKLDEEVSNTKKSGIISEEEARVLKQG